MDGLGRIALFIAAQGAVPGIRLAHAGRKASARMPIDGGIATAAVGLRESFRFQIHFGGPTALSII